VITWKISEGRSIRKSGCAYIANEAWGDTPFRTPGVYSDGRRGGKEQGNLEAESYSERKVETIANCSMRETLKKGHRDQGGGERGGREGAGQNPHGKNRVPLPGRLGGKSSSKVLSAREGEAGSIKRGVGRDLREDWTVKGKGISPRGKARLSSRGKRDSPREKRARLDV